MPYESTDNIWYFTIDKDPNQISGSITAWFGIDGLPIYKARTYLSGRKDFETFAEAKAFVEADI